MSEQIDEYTRLDRELNGVSNALFEIDGDIKAATNDDKEVTEKIEAIYSAITDLQAAIEKYKKQRKETHE